jgi:hypothetical protein
MAIIAVSLITLSFLFLSESTLHHTTVTDAYSQPFVETVKHSYFSFFFILSVITHQKRLEVNKNMMTDFEEFLDKIFPLKNANKLGAVLIQLPPSFTVNDFKNIEKFLDKLPSGYQYGVNTLLFSCFHKWLWQ